MYFHTYIFLYLDCFCHQPTGWSALVPGSSQSCEDVLGSEHSSASHTVVSQMILQCHLLAAAESCRKTVAKWKPTASLIGH